LRKAVGSKLPGLTAGGFTAGGFTAGGFTAGGFESTAGLDFRANTAKPTADPTSNKLITAPSWKVTVFSSRPACPERRLVRLSPC
jgi:hypothetical protein